MEHLAVYVRQDRRPLILARRLRAAGGPNATSERGLARTRARRPLRAAPAASPRSVLGPSAWHPQRRRDPSSRTIRVAPAAVPRPALADGLVEGLSAPGPRRVRLGEDALDRRRERLRVERRVERLHDRVVRLVGRRPRRHVRVRVVRGACGWSGSRPDGSPRLFLVARGWFASRSRRRRGRRGGWRSSRRRAGGRRSSGGRSRGPSAVGARRAWAAQGCEILNFQGSYLGQFLLVSADFWTSDHLSSSSRKVDAFSDTFDRQTLKLKYN